MIGYNEKMNRREFITVSAASATLGLSGCTTAEYTNPPEEESTPEYIELTEHDISTDSGEYFDRVTVTGTIKNTGDVRVAYVNIRSRLYDGTDIRLNEGRVDGMSIGPGSTWDFSIEMEMKSASGVQSYDIGFPMVVRSDPEEALETQPTLRNIEKFDGLVITDHDFDWHTIEFELKDATRVVRAGLIIEEGETVEGTASYGEEHDDVIIPVDGEEGYHGAVSISGTIENTSNEEIEDVVVRVRPYDDEGSELGQFRSDGETLPEEASTQFDVQLDVDARDVDRYDIAVIGSR